jgi:hypothetical protein
MEKVHVNAALKARHMDEETRNDLMEQKRLIKERIKGLQEKQKQLQAEITFQRKLLKDAKDALKKIYSDK